MKWTAEELASMAAWDAAIEAEGWTAADEEAAREIEMVLLKALLLEKLSDIQSRENRSGKKKGKGNVAAQKARWYARQKLKKLISYGKE